MTTMQADDCDNDFLFMAGPARRAPLARAREKGAASSVRSIAQLALLIWDAVSVDESAIARIIMPRIESTMISAGRPRDEPEGAVFASSEAAMRSVTLSMKNCGDVADQHPDLLVPRRFGEQVRDERDVNGAPAAPRSGRSRPAPSASNSVGARARLLENPAQVVQCARSP